MLAPLDGLRADFANRVRSILIAVLVGAGQRHDQRRPRGRADRVGTVLGHGGFSRSEPRRLVVRLSCRVASALVS